MSSCEWHPEKPAVATIEGKQLCWACDRQWYELGYHRAPPVDRIRNGGDAVAAPFTRAAVPERQAPNPYISGTPL
jgi:hypothetical protein